MLSFIHVVTTAHMHVFLDASHAASVAKHWRPQIVGTSIVSITGVEKYVNARCALEHTRCTGAVLQYSKAGHACLFITKRDAYDQLQLSCILWHTSKQMFQRMRALRKWHDDRFPDELHGKELSDLVERDMWDLTIYDA